MISANTEVILQSAAILTEKAEVIDRAGAEFEQLLRARRDLGGRLYCAFGGVRRLERRRKHLTWGLRTQSLFLRESVRRFRSVQSNVISRARKI